jgi:hypothetical protein
MTLSASDFFRPADVLSDEPPTNSAVKRNPVDRNQVSRARNRAVRLCGSSFFAVSTAVVLSAVTSTAAMTGLRTPASFGSTTTVTLEKRQPSTLAKWAVRTWNEGVARPQPSVDSVRQLLRTIRASLS